MYVYTSCLSLSYYWKDNFIFNKIIPIMNITVMAADSDGDLIETVVTCEGDLGDPEFSQKFQIIVDRLNALLCKGKLINVDL